ncbi:MAG: N-acyl homoserine lactonase family protein [Deltaproteobacteria bacterium]|nr:N-acyl homoserine lactonase family protein [Deltaproteobacteria bacterium]
MSLYKIHPIVLGTKVFDKSMMTYQHGQGQKYTIPIYSWYLEGPAGKILVDTGEYSPVRSAAREEAISGKIFTFEEGLAKWNLRPEDIDIIIHTHLHNDHCENDESCVNAAIYVHQLEIDHVHNPHPLDFRYNEDFILEVEERGQIKTIDRDIEIVPGIQVIHTPAHTQGGCSVVIQTAAGQAVITGFCCIMENFNPPPAITGMEMEVIPPGTHVHVYEAYDLLLMIRSMAEILLPLHEPGFAAVDTIG